MKKLISMTLGSLLLGISCSQNHCDNSKYVFSSPYLSAKVYGVSHFNSAQTDAFPYAVKQGTFNVDLNQLPIVYGGPVNIMALAATDSNYMWGIATDRVNYISCKNGEWKSVAELGFPNVPTVSNANLEKLVTNYTTISQIEKIAKEVLGNNPMSVTANGIYSVADKDNNVYFNAGTVICVFGLKDKNNPAKGIELKRTLQTDTIFTPMSLLGMPPAVRLIGINMTYDGKLIIGAYNGIAIVDREFKEKPCVYNIEPNQLITNSLSVDDKNGIYLASGNLQPKGDGIMRKLVWTGKMISDKEADGAWSSPYEGGNWPPAIKAGTGTGSTPTLMGFEKEKDQLVVITDGADRMHIVAFWRNEIPQNFKQVAGTKSRRIADQMAITAGRPEAETWIQSEQSVVVNGWGAFVINNVIPKGLPDKIIDVMAIGTIIASPQGTERVEWDTQNHKWKSVWTRGDVSSISTVPAVSMASNIVFVNGYNQTSGWELTGMDWNTGATVTRIIFGHNNKGNGAYSITQFLDNGDLLFNSLVGYIRVPLK